MKIEVYLCSFASPDLDLSVKRFINQASDLNFYKDIKVFRKKDLSDKMQGRISDLFKIGKKRLYGYAVWKPDIIINYLNSLPDNSLLQYSDIGCHFNKDGINRLNYYISMTDENKMLAFEYSNPPKEIIKFNYQFQKYKEYEFTKGDLIKYFGLDFRSEIINSAHIWSGTFFMKKCTDKIKTPKITLVRPHQWCQMVWHSVGETSDPSVLKILFGVPSGTLGCSKIGAPRGMDPRFFKIYIFHARIFVRLPDPLFFRASFLPGTRKNRF